MRHIHCLSGVGTTPARLGALGFAILAFGLARPDLAGARCVEQMTRMPIAAAAPAAGASAYRANMMRRATPAAAGTRKRSPKAKSSGVEARSVRKAGAHRAARKRTPTLRRAAARAPVAAPVAAPSLRQPTPMPVAAREVATPLAYALIATTVCETGPPPVAAAIPTSDGVSGLPTDGFSPGIDTATRLPPIGDPGLPIVDGPPSGGSGTTPPVIAPPPLAPPPLDPPPVVPAPVPEPGTWALMILGFGLMGAKLRRPPVRLPWRSNADTVASPR